MEGGLVDTLSENQHTRTFRDGSVVRKEAKTSVGEQRVQNAIRFLTLIPDTMTPPLLSANDTSYTTAYYPPAPPPDDEHRILISAVQLLQHLKQKHIHHGDLTGSNVFFYNNRLYVVDFDESNFHDEPNQKRAEPDDYHLCSYLISLTGDSTRVLRRWLALSPYLESTTRLVDIGTLYGYFPALASLRDIIATGLDNGMFDSRCIQLCQERWIFGNYVHRDVVTGNWEPQETTVFLSTYAHLVNQHGRAAADEVLERSIIGSKQQCFFETQLYGDGPGPAWFGDDDDVKRYLERFGTAESLLTVSVSGRNAHRTLWRIT